MSRFDEHLFGRLAVLNGYLTQKQLQESLAYQRSVETTSRKPIGEILLERGYLTERQLLEILEIRRSKLRKMLLDTRQVQHTERTFGSLAVANGYITHDQLESALLEQQRLRRLNLHLCLGDIMVSKGYMTVEGVLGVLGLQQQRIMVCTGCNSHFTVRSFSERAEYACRHCGEGLAVPRFLDTVATDGVIEGNGGSGERGEGAGADGRAAEGDPGSVASKAHGS